jgi:hypothetical protein
LTVGDEIAMNRYRECHAQLHRLVVRDRPELRLRLSLQLLGDEAIDERHVLEPAAVITWNRSFKTTTPAAS